MRGIAGVIGDHRPPYCPHRFEPREWGAYGTSSANALTLKHSGVRPGWHAWVLQPLDCLLHRTDGRRTAACLEQPVEADDNAQPLTRGQRLRLTYACNRYHSLGTDKPHMTDGLGDHRNCAANEDKERPCSQRLRSRLVWVQFDQLQACRGLRNVEIR